MSGVQSRRMAAFARADMLEILFALPHLSVFSLDSFSGILHLFLVIREEI
jgi:hypothetical protein